MRSHQQKFLATVEAAAKEMGLEMVVDMHYANGGNVTVSFEDRYDPIVKFSFQFQTDYATFDAVEKGTGWALANPERTDQPDKPGMGGRYWWYLRPEEFPEIIKPIRNKMAQAVMDRQRIELELDEAIKASRG